MLYFRKRLKIYCLLSTADYWMENYTIDMHKISDFVRVVVEEATLKI